MLKELPQSNIFTEQLRVVSPDIKNWFPIPNDGEVNINARIRPERIIIPDRVIEGLGRYTHKFQVIRNQN